MNTFFLTCALLGGAVLVVQMVLGVLGADHHHGDVGHGHFHVGGDSHLHEALDLFSVRALSAGLTFFGFAGMAVIGMGLPGLLALPVALVVGAGAAVGVAYIMRQLLRLEQDNTGSIAETVGTVGTVYLPVPGERGGIGKVHLTLRNRTLECAAVTPNEALVTGAPILVIDVSGEDTVVVVSHPSSAEVPSHVAP